ncbi:MAG: hypothetical protein H6704_24345 [Myxococcales bacterium]|nr:hypothetical protein [Myxococcales bacterium]
MRRQVGGWAVGLMMLTLLAAPGAARAQSSDPWAGAGLGLGGILAIAVGGGLLTTILIGIDVVDDRTVSPALRNVALGCAGVNIAFGTTGLILTGYLDEEDADLKPVLYSVSGAVLALGLVGGGFALAAEPWATKDPQGQALRLAPTPGGAAAVWTGTF